MPWSGHIAGRALGVWLEAGGGVSYQEDRFLQGCRAEAAFAGAGSDVGVEQDAYQEVVVLDSHG